MVSYWRVCVHALGFLCLNLFVGPRLQIIKKTEENRYNKKTVWDHQDIFCKVHTFMHRPLRENVLMCKDNIWNTFTSNCVYLTNLIIAYVMISKPPLLPSLNMNVVIRQQKDPGRLMDVLGEKQRDGEREMDGWSAKVSRRAICLLELMTQRLRDRKPLYCPWWLSTEQAPSVMGNWDIQGLLAAITDTVTHISHQRLSNGVCQGQNKKKSSQLSN